MQKNDEFRSMSKSMGIVIFFTMISKVLGMWREMVLSSSYGMDWITDAYKQALDLPNLILSVVITAIAAVFIPIYNSRMAKSKADAERFVSNLYTVGMILTLLVSLLTFFMLDWLVDTFMAAEESRPLTLQLAQIMMPMTIFTFLHKLTTSYLQAHSRFAVPAAAPVFFNLFIVAGIMLSGGNIYMVAIATLVGTAAQFAIQIPSMRRAGFSYRPTLDLQEPGLRTMMMMMVPVLIASAFDQVYSLIDRYFVSDVAGNISALDYGNRISTMVSAVLLTTIATVLYPSLVRSAKDREAYADKLSLGMNLNLLVGIPAMAALLLLRIPVTRLVYERNSFTASHTLITAGPLGCYALGLLGVGVRELCSRGFYALGEVKVPTIVGIGAVLLNIVLDYAMKPLMGVSGVALATSIASTLSGLLLFLLLRRRVKDVGERRILICLGKTGIATAGMCLVLWGCTRAFSLTAVTGMRLLMLLGGTMVGGLLVYLLVLLALRTEELRMVLDLFKRRVRKDDVSV